MIITHREKMERMDLDAFNEYQLEIDRRKREMQNKPLTDKGSS